MKDFILFFLHYSDHNKILKINEQKLIIRILDRFINERDTFDINQKIIYLPILISSLKLVKLYHPILLPKAVDHIIDIMSSKDKRPIDENLTFITLIQSIYDTYEISNKEIFRLINNLV